MELAPEYRYSVFKSPLLFHFSFRLNCRCPFLGALPYRRRARGFHVLSSNAPYVAGELRPGNNHRHNQASLRIMPHLLARRRPFLPNKNILAQCRGLCQKCKRKTSNVPALTIPVQRVAQDHLYRLRYYKHLPLHRQCFRKSGGWLCLRSCPTGCQST